jgi:hypothetical protein
MQVPTRPDPERLHAAAFALRAWVLAAASVLAAVVWRYSPRSWRIEARSFIRIAMGDLKYLIVVLAATHWKLGGFCKRTMHPHSTPTCFRRGRNTISVVRKFKRLVRMPTPAIARYRRLSRAMACQGAVSPVAQRIAWMRDVLRDLRAWMARVHRGFAWLKSGPRFVAVRPAAAILIVCAMPSVTVTDTS